MNLYSKLRARSEAGPPLRIGMIGAGKFGSMFLAQMLKLPGIHLVGVVDLVPATAISNMRYVGWPDERFAARSLDDAAQRGLTHVGDNAQALVAHPSIDIVIECTGNPMAAVEHCLAAFAQGKHVINVTVEATPSAASACPRPQTRPG
jgi:predicted homoserine dehydrogenase-like protein